MKDNLLEVGDVMRAGVGTFWFIEAIITPADVNGRCIRPAHPGMWEIGQVEALGRRLYTPADVIAKARDFEHACAIVALIA